MKSKEFKITYMVLFIVLLVICNISFAADNESSSDKNGNDAFLEWLQNEESESRKSKKVSERITKETPQSYEVKTSDFDLFQDDNENGINDKFEKDRSESYKASESSSSSRSKSSSSSSSSTKSSYTPSKTKKEDKTSSSSRTKSVKSSSSSKSKKRIK